MPANQIDTIYPCPFSKDYGIPASQAWLLLKIFFIFRFISASLFVMLFYLKFGHSELGEHDRQLYQFSSLAYLLISLLSAPFIVRQLASYNHLSQLSIFTDILFITLLMHASGGVTSGVGGLLAVSIAAGGLLIGGRCAILFAALASLAVLAEEVYNLQTQHFDMSTLKFSGFLGICFFAIGLISVVLAQRVEYTASIVRSHARTIVRLEELNRYIIQHLQSGIVIVDERQSVLLSNQSLLRLLNLAEPPIGLKDVSSQLQQAFVAWNQQRKQDFAVLQFASQQTVQVRFSQITVEGEALFMLIFEDMSLYNQRLQQGKLASLGRLTASIAHEIRNPLSAISHAGQLLSEAPDLKAEDLRLTEIIQNHSQRVNRIIEDILRLSRRSPSQRQRIELDQWLTDYVAEQNELAFAYQQPFVLEINQSGQSGYIDPGHLKQILDNLCANALIYGRPELGKISLRLSQQDDAPLIAVIDNGTGVDSADLLHLFEPFFTTSHQGTGLGLYISRELAELNQAQLSYAKQQEQTCFTLALANANHAVIEI